MGQEDNFFIIGQFSLAGIVTAIIIIYIQYKLSNSREKMRFRLDRGQELIRAFRPELDALIQSDNDCRLILTEEAFKRHESAIRAFAPYLFWINRLRFRRAWYRLAMIKVSKKQHIPFYSQYADCGSLDKRRKVRPIVIKHIQDIISFADK